MVVIKATTTTIKIKTKITTITTITLVKTITDKTTIKIITTMINTTMEPSSKTAKFQKPKEWTVN